MAISRADFLFFVIELVTRNLNLGVPALEDGLFANLLIFDYSSIYAAKHKGFLPGLKIWGLGTTCRLLAFSL